MNIDESCCFDVCRCRKGRFRREGAHEMRREEMICRRKTTGVINLARAVVATRGRRQKFDILMYG